MAPESKKNLSAASKKGKIHLTSRKCPPLTIFFTTIVKNSSPVIHRDPGLESQYTGGVLVTTVSRFKGRTRLTSRFARGAIYATKRTV